MALSEKQKMFCNEYLIDLNATQAAIRTGYSKKTARSQGQRLLTHDDIKAYISALMEEKEKKLIADQDEVLKYLTAVIRDKTDSETIVVEGVGEGCSEAKVVRIKPSEKDKLKAAELLGKRYGIYTEKVHADVIIPVFAGEEDLEE